MTTWHPLTEAARGIYFATQLDPENPSYNTAECVELPAEVDVEALRRALLTVYAENEGFRARFASHGAEPVWQALALEDFLPRVGVLRPVELPEPRMQDHAAGTDPAREAVMEWCRDAASSVLDLASGQTVDSALIRCGGRAWLHHCFHHAVADGFAASEALRRVGRLYGQIAAGEEPPELERPGLADLAAQERAEADRRVEDLESWTRLLEAETGREDDSLAQRAAPPSARAHRVALPLGVELQEALDRAARTAGAGWAAAIIAATGSYLSRALGREAVRVGVPQMNRVLPSGPRAAARTGCTAVNVLPVTVSAGGTPEGQIAAVVDQTDRNRRTALARHEELEGLCARRGERLFGAQVNVIPFEAEIPFGTGTARVRNVTAGPVADLTVGVRGMPGHGAEIELQVDANPSLYSRRQAKQHARRLQRWMGQWALAAASGVDTGTLEQALPEELEAVRGFNATRRPLETATLLERFEERAVRHPALVALREGPAYPEGAAGGGRELTYAQLRRTARATARRLLGVEEAPGGVVALRVERGIEQFELLYALLYAGAAYLPIDPELPAARVSAMLEDAGCRLLVNGPGLSPLACEGPVVEISAEDLAVRPEAGAEAGTAEDADAADLPGHRTGPEDIAYVQFTSGSTGRPKGVPVTHAALDNRLQWQQHLAPLDPGDRVAHKTAISFDVHVWELYWPLQRGAAVVIAAPGGHRDPEYLARLIAEERIACLHFVPTMLSALIASPAARRVLADARPALRHLVCSGEALTRDQVRGAHDLLGVHPLNLYGPTEAAIDVTAWHTGRDPEAALVPIGAPAWNTGCYVVDPHGRLCPPGVPGELCLTGVQVMGGYLNRPEADAAALTSLDLPGRARALRAYRTGDLALWREDGVLEYRGRRDHQVKIGGQRLELGEVEAVLAEAPGVSAATVTVRSVAQQDVLAAFVEMSPEDLQDPGSALDAVRDHAAGRLPGYMVPALWRALDSMPVTANGKADRRALDRIELAAPDRGEPPRSLREQLMCELFGDVLGEPAGPETDFFAAGGASLSALDLCHRIETRFGRRCSLAAIFAHPTPRALAESLDDGAPGDLEPALLLRRGTDPDAVPIVFLPPAGGLGWCYAGLLRHLDPRRTVWALQVPQFADPSVPWPEDLGALAEDYLGTIRRLAPGRVSLAGWSVGGMAAVEAAARAPEAGVDIERVVLLDAYPPAYWRSQAEPEESDLWLALLRMGRIEPKGVPEGLEGTVGALREHGSALAALDDDALRTSVSSVWRAMGYTRGESPRPLERHVVHCGAEQTLRHGADPALWEEHCRSVGYVELEGDHVAVLAGENGRRVAAVLESV